MVIAPITTSSAILRRLLTAVLLVLCFTQAVHANFTNNGDGTVTDIRTGLTWMRCALGQTWTGSSCTGTANTYSWDQAIALTHTFAGHSDWRLPKIRELTTIVDYSRFGPALDPVAFPASPNSLFWSSSTDVANSSFAWFVGFSGGGASSSYKSLAFQVRLVRAGQSSALLNDARPDADYHNNGDGTVTHLPSGLTWMRCALGQTWTGSSCTGSASSYSWDQAIALTHTFAGQSDWRTPSIGELLSLLDYTRSGPAINPAMFPNTPASAFWSASADANLSYYAWYVTFSNGYSLFYDMYHNYQVRLVRGFAGTAPGAPTITRLMPGNGLMRIAFTPPVMTGGIAITSYTASCFRNGVIHTATGASSPITVTGLTNGVSYTCTVSATNSVGTGTASLEATKVVRPASIAPIVNILMH